MGYTCQPSRRETGIYRLQEKLFVVGGMPYNIINFFKSKPVRDFSVPRPVIKILSSPVFHIRAEFSIVRSARPSYIRDV